MKDVHTNSKDVAHEVKTFRRAPFSDTRAYPTILITIMVLMFAAFISVKSMGVDGPTGKSLGMLAGSILFYAYIVVRLKKKTHSKNIYENGKEEADEEDGEGEIILSDRGIVVSGDGDFPWKEMTDVYTMGINATSNSDPSDYLVIVLHNLEKKSFRIDDLEHYQKIRKLINRYRVTVRERVRKEGTKEQKQYLKRQATLWYGMAVFITLSALVAIVWSAYVMFFS